MSEILPKKRARDGTTKRYHSNVQDLANKGRVISGRSVSKLKRVMSNRGDLFDDANNSYEDGINFDLNRNTIMSNFEEWIKLSTDNKITLKNSWQFALIDYFHDLNVIKDGDDINFQRASATLDGCVKIYSSRVESVATETGKLLSGLAQKKNDEADDEEAEGEEETEDGEIKKTRKINRVMESTLVLFETIKVKKLEQELAIDPLFKKALAEFDEGGAKSLLLNTLNIDKTGRVIFDATTTGNKAEAQESPEELETKEIKLSNIQRMLFRNEPLESLLVCPSINQLKDVLNDIDSAKSILTDVNNKFLDSQNEKSLSRVEFDFGDYNDNNYDDNNYDDNNGDDNGNDYNTPMADGGMDFEQETQKQNDEDEYEQGPGNQILDQDLMAYFDETMKLNWRGPEHWKVSAYKKSKNIAVKEEAAAESKPEAPKKKKKENTYINFFEEDEIDDEELFARPSNVLSLKKKDSGAETVLPEDIRYNSTRLITLFLKKNTSIMYYPKVKKTVQSDQFTDENYFAEQYNQQDRMASFHQAQFEEINQDYEENDGDVFGGIDFNDALAEEEPDNRNNLLIGGRKVRPEYVNFSRIAKRVDVKLLKDNLWKGIKVEKSETQPVEEEQPVKKSFGELVETVGKMYPTEEKKDLSTSFCFICLLHLANEHSLTVTSNENHDDLTIMGF